MSTHRKLEEETGILRDALACIRGFVVWDVAWRPLACYAFIKIKLTSCHLLLYLVYASQNSFNFIDAFDC